jgi:hypothetical protein
MMHPGFGVAMKRALFALTYVICAGFVSPWAFAGEQAVAVRQEGGWVVCETAHFAVWASISTDEAKATAHLCETLHRELQSVWFERPPADWPSKCVVVLHASSADFAAAISQPGTRAVGCITLQVDRGAVIFRRIDLRCDRPNWRSSALPHELTHAVLADRLNGRPLPLWADEGLAVLAEPETTRTARDRALLAAVRSGRTVPIPALLHLTSQPGPDLREAFYGQSAILVSRLIERKSPSAFLAFLERTQQVGDEAALRECYRIDGVSGLARLWSEYANAATPGQFVELTERAAIRPGAAIASTNRRSAAATP